MKEGPDIARIAALIGDPARANMLTALLTGKALTASELAMEAGVTPQTASAHLHMLDDGGLVGSRKQGRHKYFTLAGPQVASLLESLMNLSCQQGSRWRQTGPRDTALRAARVCYNHLAGEAGVQLYDSLIIRGFLAIDTSGLNLTDAGREFIISFGLDPAELVVGRSPVCRACLDWSERRSHLAGRLGRGIFSQLQRLGWISIKPGSRVVTFSRAGSAGFLRSFGPRSSLSS